MFSRARWFIVLGVSLFVGSTACTEEEAPSDGGATTCRGDKCAAGSGSSSKGGSAGKGGGSGKGGSVSQGGNDAAGANGGDAGTGGDGPSGKGGSSPSGKGGNAGTSGSSAGQNAGGSAPSKGGAGGTSAKGGSSGTGGTGGPGSSGTGGSTSSGDEWEEGRQLCVDKINEYRATVGKAPLERWKAGEPCADQHAANDAVSNVPHQGFQTIKCGGGGGQNECPGYATVPSGLLQCLGQMWAEGPTPDGTWDVAHGHYMNMFGDYTYSGYTQHFDRVACGFAKAPGGGVWSVQNFQ